MTEHITIATPEGWTCDRCNADYLHTHTTYNMTSRKPEAEEEVTEQPDPSVYSLKNVEEGFQTLFFIKKAPVSPDSTEMETVQDGTTNEEVIAVLIDRLTILNGWFPSEYNTRALVSLNEALSALGDRTRERAARGVEGTHQ